MGTESRGALFKHQVQPEHRFSGVTTCLRETSQLEISEYFIRAPAWSLL
jgi:hypothetical protein